MRKILFWNILIVFLLFCFFELVVWAIQIYKTPEYLACTNCQKSIIHVCKEHREYAKYKFLKYKNFDEAYKDYYKKFFMEYVNSEYKKKPIVIFGCSFAQGWSINPDYSLSSLLHKLTKRPVYTRAYADYFSMAQMLYQTKREDTYNEIEPPEHVIFVYITDHLRRISLSHPDMFFPFPYLRYKLNKNNILEEEKFPFKYNFYTFRQYTTWKEQFIKQEEKEKLMYEFFVQSKNELDKHWNNYQFTILVYENNEQENQIWKNLEKKEFKIVYVDELLKSSVIDEKYTINDCWHPNEKAWETITPQLIDILKL